MQQEVQREVNEQTEKLRQLKAKPEEENKNKAALYVNILHDMKTPLTLLKNSIAHYAAKLHKPGPDIINMKQQIDILCHDIINCLEVTELEKGSGYYTHDTILNLSEQMKNKLLIIETAIADKGLTASFRIEENIFIKADPAALDRVFYNLFDNALKYTEAGSISIELSRKNNSIIFSIKDSGIGISADEQKNIFLPYYQVLPKKRNRQGIGMGLYIARQIVDELKGEIKVESKLSAGSTFTVILPLHELKPDETVTDSCETLPLINVINKPKIEKLEYTPEKNTLLLIEDNPDFLCYMHDCLQEKYNVFSARNGKEALEILPAIPKLRLILCDIMMDEMDGYEFYDELKRRDMGLDIPFIFVTAKTSAGDRLMGLRKGAISYINKPFLIDELEVKIDSLIKLQHKKEMVYKKEIKAKLLDVLEKDDGADDDLAAKIKNLLIKYKITEREKDVIYWLKLGYAHKQIADKLKISVYTVQRHLDKIYKKCNVQTSIQLISLFYS